MVLMIGLWVRPIISSVVKFNIRSNNKVTNQIIKRKCEVVELMHSNMHPRVYYNDADKRKRQIDTLKIFNDNVVEVKENAEYRVNFNAGNHNMSLEIILGTEFPNEKPIILVNPAVTHPWVTENSNEVYGAPGLLNYTVHSDLGRVVQAIIREFRSIQFLNGETSYNTESKHSTVSPLHSSMGSICFPELNELTIDELQELLENTDLQDRLLGSNPQLTELDLETEELMNSIEMIAKDNMSKQQTLEEFKTAVIDRISKIVQLKSNYEELNKKHQKLSEAYDPYKIRECLHDAAVKAEEEAEAIAEQFLAGNMPVETFIAQYAERRALGQARKAREERLAHQLDQLDRATL